MTLPKTRDVAAGKWDGILMTLVPELEPFIGTSKHGPCPVHKNSTDGFRLFNDGSGGGICGQCGAFPTGFDILKFLRDWDFPRAAREVDGVIGMTENDKPVAEKADPAVRLKKIQMQAQPAGEFVAKYLKGRGLSKMPPTLLQAKLNYWEDGKKIGTYVTMIAKVTSALGQPVTFHLTYLEAGSKAAVLAPKKLMPPAGILAGAAIRLWPATDHVGVAEGIETAIAARELSNIPCWAVMNTNGMMGFIPPENIKKVTIFADRDANYAGELAAYTLANRLTLKGLEVEVKVPPELGDWLDVLNAG